MNITPDNQCCGAQISSEQKIHDPGHIQYQFDTPGATVKVEVQDKREPDPDRGVYRTQCHEALDAVVESGSRKQSLLLDRIHRVVRALTAWKTEAEDARLTLKQISAEFFRALPGRFASDTLAAQAKALVDRFLHVKSELEMVSRLNKRQYEHFQELHGAFLPVDNSSTPILQKTTNVVNRYLSAQKTVDLLNEDLTKVGLALQAVEEKLTSDYGVDVRTTGTLAERVQELGAALRKAMEANRKWASAGCTIGLTANQKADYENQIQTLRQENNRLRKESENRNQLLEDRVSIYKSSVDRTHEKLDELGIGRGGSVASRLQSFVDSIHAALSGVQPIGTRQQLKETRTVQEAVRKLVESYNALFS